jgi:hypothetical protein
MVEDLSGIVFPHCECTAHVSEPADEDGYPESGMVTGIRLATVADTVW